VALTSGYTHHFVGEGVMLDGADTSSSSGSGSGRGGTVLDDVHASSTSGSTRAPKIA
jgi:hypothetical protein